VFGSRRDAPGVLPRVLGGEDPAQVRQCAFIIGLACEVTGRVDVTETRVA